MTLPSAGELMRALSAMLPPWPGMLTTTTGLPISRVSPSASTRAASSVACPGGKPTIILVCAAADGAKAAQPVKSAAIRNLLSITTLPMDMWSAMGSGGPEQPRHRNFPVPERLRGGEAAIGRPHHGGDDGFTGLFGIGFPAVDDKLDHRFSSSRQETKSYAHISSCNAIQALQQWDGNHRQGQNPKGARDRPLEEREYPPVRLDHGADEVLLQHGAEHHAQDRRRDREAVLFHDVGDQTE